jgi:hypothetical protein
MVKIQTASVRSPCNCRRSVYFRLVPTAVFPHNVETHAQGIQSRNPKDQALGLAMGQRGCNQSVHERCS